jgi:hypothetical protein
MDLNTQPISADRLQPNTRKLLELLLDMLALGEGAWRLELEVQDGRVTGIWRYSKPSGSDLADWRLPDEPAA